MDHFLRMCGFEPTPIPGPLKIFQQDRFIGTVPGFPVRSRSGIFDVRPTDFTPEQRDGETVLRAAWNIGPGDFECLEGFRRGDGREAEPGEAARLFDTMALASGSRSEAMRFTIEEMLATPRAAQGMEAAAAGETRQGLDPKGSAARAEGIAQPPSPSPSNRNP